MDASYVRARASVDRVLKAKGQTVSVVVTNDAGVSRTFKVPGAVFDIELKYVDGTNILKGDKRLLLSAVGITSPIDTTTRITIGAVKHAVVDPGPFAPAGDVIFYSAIVRSGG